MTTESGSTLDRLLCFALHSASRAFTNLYRPFLDEAGLTYPQYLVMLVLWERESVTVKELGGLLRLDSGTLSPLLKRLQTRGLLARARSEADERSVRVEVTDEGRALWQQARDIPQRMVSATGMDLGEVEQLRSTLENLTTTLNDAARRVTENRETKR
ncbi:MarR family winged helix-turn-helix transcriptional regulator [Saccharopolyspora endophytica]|uniref:MarR family transcriptional regulator n=1 Tax=Saccharopolyspora endophytica TaxID=543886 RepID=A0ABS5DG07_9PSEU|nr:MarR family transcriptional regulator [Saccharopolyspora endophytica]MBQ0925214.1 MarR family transcriptional regulator [Saccharopolyspora endophytica]